MADPQQKTEGNLADSIAMLEQILEVMPQDTDAIQALYNAYCNVGDLERAFEHLNTLVDVVSGGGNPEVLAFVQDELPQFKEIFPGEVSAQHARLRILKSSIEFETATKEKIVSERSGSDKKKNRG